MRNFISNFRFMINRPGPIEEKSINRPGPIEEKSRNLNAAVGTMAMATSSGMFAGDCLINWLNASGANLIKT
jgi:hypothetical protein